MRLNKKVLFLITCFILILTLFSLSHFSQANLNSEKIGELKVTLEHPFFVDGEWIKAEDLKEGDLLTTINGKKARIISIERVHSNKSVSVYNIKVNETETYFVSDEGLGGVLVHNKAMPLPPEKVLAAELIDRGIVSYKQFVEINGEWYIKISKKKFISLKGIISWIKRHSPEGATPIKGKSLEEVKKIAFRLIGDAKNKIDRNIDVPICTEIVEGGIRKRIYLKYEDCYIDCDRKIWILGGEVFHSDFERLGK